MLRSVPDCAARLLANQGATLWSRGDRARNVLVCAAI